MTLSYTPTTSTYTDMFEFMHEKVWYEFGEDATVWDTWDAANTSANDITAKAIFGSRTLTIYFNNAFIGSWPAGSATFPAYVTKYSGMCLADYSSQMGGFCLLEDNDTDMTGVNSGNEMYNISGGGTLATVVGQSTNQKVNTYRLTAAQFTALETAWTDMTVIDTATSF